MNNQEITKHRLSIELTPDEWQELQEKAAAYGLSRSELAEQFIKDLIGIRGAGSDEERIAREWYERSRCNYSGRA